MIEHDPWSQKYFGPHTEVVNRKMSTEEKRKWEEEKKWFQEIEDLLESTRKELFKRK